MFDVRGAVVASDVKKLLAGRHETGLSMPLDRDGGAAGRLRSTSTSAPESGPSRLHICIGVRCDAKGSKLETC